MELDLQLRDDEPRILVETLESYLSDLSVEIGHTDSMDFREGLKHRQAALTRIVDALRAARSGG